MNKPTCNYVFLARTAFRDVVNGDIKFNINEKKFENENPILAREAVFAHRAEFLRGMLTEGIGKNEDEIGWNSSEKKIEKLSEKEIRKLINPFLEPEDKVDSYEEKKTDWKAPTDTFSWYPSFNNGIWIIMKHNDCELHEEYNIMETMILLLIKFLVTKDHYLLRQTILIFKKNMSFTKSISMIPNPMKQALYSSTMKDF